MAVFGKSRTFDQFMAVKKRFDLEQAGPLNEVKTMRVRASAIGDRPLDEFVSIPKLFTAVMSITFDLLPISIVVAVEPIMTVYFLNLLLNLKRTDFQIFFNLRKIRKMYFFKRWKILHKLIVTVGNGFGLSNTSIGDQQDH